MSSMHVLLCCARTRPPCRRPAALLSLGPLDLHAKRACHRGVSAAAANISDSFWKHASMKRLALFWTTAGGVRRSVKGDLPVARIRSDQTVVTQTFALERCSGSASISIEIRPVRRCCTEDLKGCGDCVRFDLM